MTHKTRDIILQKATHTFAQSGYDGFSVRLLAEQIPVAPSVLYHHFKDKDALLKDMFDLINYQLGKKRAALKIPKTASEMLKQRIVFQIDNQESIVAVIKYYLAYRMQFKKFREGYVPDKSILHIEEVLRYGQELREFSVTDIESDAKVITHAINGFLLEYYPHTPKGKEKSELVDRIYTFLIRSLKEVRDNEELTAS